MPQVGETRTYQGETRTWDGSRWTESVAAPGPQQEGALSRFFGGAMKTSPLNPMNLVRAIASPGETIASMMTDPLANMLKVPGDIKAAITGERGDRLSAGAEALAHIGGSVPLIGPAGIRAGEKIGEGDIAGGAGELTGLASGAMVPKVASEVPRGMKAMGRGMEEAGNFLKNKGSLNVGGVHIPIGSAIGVAEAAMGHGPMGLVTAAAPYALEYGGKGLQAGGEALEGLKNLGTPKTTTRFKTHRNNSEVPYRAPSEVPEYTGQTFEEPLSPIDEFYRDNPMGEGRTTSAGKFATDSGEPLGEGGLESLAALSKAKTPSQAILHDMEESYGHGPTADAQPWDTVVPDFTFEGESNVHPGEFAPGPAAEGFDVGEPSEDAHVADIRAKAESLVPQSLRDALASFDNGLAARRARYGEQLASSPSFAALTRRSKRGNP